MLIIIFVLIACLLVSILLGKNGLSLIGASQIFNSRPPVFNDIQLPLGFLFLAEVGSRALVVQSQIVLHVHLQDVLGEPLDGRVPVSRRVLVQRTVDDWQHGLRVEAGETT